MKPRIRHLFAAAERTCYESKEARDKILAAIKQDAIKSFPGASNGEEALLFALRHETDRLEAAESRVEDALGDYHRISAALYQIAALQTTSPEGISCRDIARAALEGGEE